MEIKNVLDNFNELRALIYLKMNMNEITCRSNPIRAAYVSVRSSLHGAGLIGVSIRVYLGSLPYGQMLVLHCYAI